MSFPKLAVSARKIHRFLVIFIVILGLINDDNGNNDEVPQPYADRSVPRAPHT